VLVYLPYAVSVGGDFMGLHRFIMPVFVVAAIAVTLGLEWLPRQYGRWLAAAEKTRRGGGSAMVVHPERR